MVQSRERRQRKRGSKDLAFACCSRLVCLAWQIARTSGVTRALTVLPRMEFRSSGFTRVALREARGSSGRELLETL
jgi:hypothetical protein